MGGDLLSNSLCGLSIQMRLSRHHGDVGFRKSFDSFVYLVELLVTWNYLHDAAVWCS